MARPPEASVEAQFLYEHRLGRRAQYEINVPLAFHQDVGGSWSRGLGDVNVALKYALYDSLPRGLIVSAGGEVTLPTGDETAGLGGGVTIFEGFGMFGQGAARRRLPAIPRRVRGAVRRRRGEQSRSTGGPRSGRR